MVFENFYKSDYLIKNKPIIFVIAMAYTVFGIASSFLLFSQFHQSAISLAIISLLILITFKDILKLSVETIKAEKMHGVNVVEIFTAYKKSLVIFSYIFGGVLCGFALFSLILPVTISEYFFKSQISLLHTESVKEIFSPLAFKYILNNNIIVLAVCFITSFLFGLGTVFLFIVIWNASVIGVVFGIIAKHTAASMDLNPFGIFLIVLFGAMPHIILEISGYLLAGITGENISSYMLFEEPKKYAHFNLLKLTIIFSLFSVLLILFGAFIEAWVAPIIIELFL